MRRVLVAAAVMLASASSAMAQTPPPSYATVLRLEPQASLPASCVAAGRVCLWYNTAVTYFQLHLADGTNDTLATLTRTQTLTGKTMSGASNTFSNIPQSAVTGLTAALNAVGANSVLNFPTGNQTQVDHGQLWEAGVELSKNFYWDFWVQQSLAGGQGYLVSDGYGPDHGILFGYSGGAITGNIWDGSGVVSIGCNDTVADGEWHHAWMSGDGTNMFVAVNGIPCGAVALPAERHAGQGVIYVGGSDHINMVGSVAFMRAVEGATPYGGYVGKAQIPQRFFGQRIIGQDWGPETALLADYTKPGATIADYGMLNGIQHPGRLTNATVIDVFNQSHPFFTLPIPAWTIDPLCPITTPSATNWGQAAPPSPPSPPVGALVYDSFSRADQTLATQVAPTLGSTESGSLGAKAWLPADGPAGSTIGIFRARAVVLDSDPVPVIKYVEMSGSSGALDHTVAVTRRVPGLTATSGDAGIVLRYVDANNYVACARVPSDGLMYLYKVVAGVVSTLASAAAANPVGFTTLTCTAKGDAFVLKTDGNTVVSGTAASMTGTKVGMLFYWALPASATSLGRLDDFTVSVTP